MELKWHRGSVVQNFIEENNLINDNKSITVIYFPTYSPEENPQEHVWKKGRQAVTHNKFIPDIDKAALEFVEFLNNNSFAYTLEGFRVRS